MTCFKEASLKKYGYNNVLVNLKGEEISNLTGIEKFNELEVLVLDNNKIEDISHLRNMVKLRYLSLVNNKIKDISPLSDLVDLGYLSLNDNRIEDITPIKHLKNLKELELKYNNIKDIEDNRKVILELGLEREKLKGNPIYYNNKDFWKLCFLSKISL